MQDEILVPIKDIISSLEISISAGTKALSQVELPFKKRIRYTQRLNDLFYQQYYCQTLYYQSILLATTPDNVELIFVFMSERIKNSARDKDTDEERSFADATVRDSGLLQQVLDAYGQFTADYDFSNRVQFANDFFYACVAIADYFIGYRTAVFEQSKIAK